MDIKVQKEVNEVSKGICIYTIIIGLLSFLISKEPIPIIMGVVFGSIIAILNFRLLAIAIEKSVDLSAGKAQAYSGIRYLIRMFIVAVVLFVSVKNPNINVIGTVLGLISTQIVIFIKKLVVSKIWGKEV